MILLLKLSIAASAEKKNARSIIGWSIDTDEITRKKKIDSDYNIYRKKIGIELKLTSDKFQTSGLW